MICINMHHDNFVYKRVSLQKKMDLFRSHIVKNDFLIFLEFENAF
jgi:hypothetical protein